MRFAGTVIVEEAVEVAEAVEEVVVAVAEVVDMIVKRREVVRAYCTGPAEVKRAPEGNERGSKTRTDSDPVDALVASQSVRCIRPRSRASRPAPLSRQQPPGNNLCCSLRSAGRP